jgi:hypothetical protein
MGVCKGTMLWSNRGRVEPVLVPTPECFRKFSLITFRVESLWMSGKQTLRVSHGTQLITRDQFVIGV